MKLKSFFIPRIRENYIKPLTVLVGKSKIKATLFSTFLLILIALEVMDSFCMERNSTIFSKLKKLRLLPRPFPKTLTRFH